jgi:outer membrane protein OmpA-like peptidoglycan-associated protein
MNESVRWVATLVATLSLAAVSSHGESSSSAPPELVDAVMRSVYFDPGQAEIPERFVPILRGNALTMTSSSGWRYVMITGHCDQTESTAPSGCRDSQRVANVRDKLLELGVDPAFLRTEVRGAAEPAIPGDVEAAWRYNRRVDFSAWK